MGKCAKRAFQSGGQVSKADQLIAEMNAKYGVSGNSQPAPTAVQQPAPKPQPAPQQTQQRGIVGNALELISGRQRQIDKASGYANGGKIQGPGTPTSDSIPATVRETGENIAVSTEERIVSAEQGALLEGMAKRMGFDNLDQMLEAGTGKPVGPTIKAGKRAAAGGMSPEEEQKRIEAFGATPPTLGTGINGMVRANPDTGFVTGPAPGVAPPPQAGRNAAGIITADSAKSVMEDPMQRTGGIAGSFDGKGVNDILARENKARGEMIDSMVAANGGNGIAVLPDRADEINQQMVLNKLSPSERATYELGRGRNDAAIAQVGITSRGQDLDYRKAANHDATIMRGQDISGANDAIRAGIDRERLGMVQADSRRADEKWGVERGILQGQAADSEAVRGARAELNAAIAGGDPRKIESAKAKAVAAGIKFDKPNNEYVTTTDSMGMNITRTNKDTGAVDVIEGKSGKIKASIPGPGTQHPTRRIPTDEEIAATAQNRGMSVDAVRKLLGL